MLSTSQASPEVCVVVELLPEGEILCLRAAAKSKVGTHLFHAKVRNAHWGQTLGFKTASFKFFGGEGVVYRNPKGVSIYSSPLDVIECPLYTYPL